MELAPGYNSTADRFQKFRELYNAFWAEVEPRLPAIKPIIDSHFGSSCHDLTPLGEGAWARTYTVSLVNGERYVLRVVLPARDVLKTEAEVATMDLVRARTAIPVPKVHLFCSTKSNPLGAEWIIMEFLPGERFMDCWLGLSPAQRNRTAEDLAKVMHELYAITSDYCGSILEDVSLRHDQRAQRFGDRPKLPPTIESCTSSGTFVVGPANDLPFMETLYPAPYERCGPFRSERQYLEAIAFANILDTDADIVKARRWPYEKVLEIYDSVHPHYASRANSTVGDTSSSDSLFHLWHGDLSISNILLDKETGRVAGIVDWEVAGFRPAWLAASNGEWLEDDDIEENEEDEGEEELASDEDEDEVYFRHRLFFQDAPENLPLRLPGEHELRKHFLAHLAACSPSLAYHYEHGTELRVIYQGLRMWLSGEVINWLKRYPRTNPLPFDYDAWRDGEYEELWQRLCKAGILI